MNISITAVSVTSIAGHKPIDILNNIICHNCGPILDKNLTAKAPGEINQYPIYIASIPKYKNFNLNQCFSNMITDTLTNLFTQLPENLNFNKVLIHTVVPTKTNQRCNLFSKKLLQNLITNIDAKYAAMQFNISHYDQGVCQCLQSLCAKLHNDEYDAIIFGGIDSLVNLETIIDLGEQRRLLTTFCNFGLAPGEAAAFVLLQKTNNNKATSIKNISYVEEPNSGYADTKELIGLSTAIQNVLTAPKNIDNIILSLGAEPNDTLEWNQVTQTIWPSHSYTVPKEIITHQALGEIGAAMIPLCLALTTTLSGNTLICEANEYHTRGAILITTNGEII
jgi:3-oxoacyl-[acyl-carrier-protein] synthase-1